MASDARNAACRVCGQATMSWCQVRIGRAVVWVGKCADCDAGHCPRCRRHLRVGERFCTECGTNVTLGTVAGSGAA